MDPHSARRDVWPWADLACALAFLAIATLVVRRGGLAFDEPFAAALQGLPVPAWFWEACTFLGGAILVPIGAAFVLAAALSRRVRLALIVAVVLVAATLFTDLFKDFVARPRPPGEPLVSASGYSFPSGHAVNSTATYGLLAVIAWRSRLPLAIRRVAVVGGVMLPLLVGLSRIALGVHYPTDVLGGWLAGVTFIALAATLIRMTGAMERDVPRRASAAPTSQP